jgi:hypothetical protein
MLGIQITHVYMSGMPDVLSLLKHAGYDNLTIDGTRMPDAYGLRAVSVMHATDLHSLPSNLPVVVHGLRGCWWAR